MAKTENMLIIVNSTEPYSQFAAYLDAFMAKNLGNVPKVTIFYGPKCISLTKKGELAKITIPDEMKELIAGQFEGLSSSDLPDNLEQMARFQKDQLGVTITSCGTVNVIEGFGKTIDDTSNIEDFIVPLKLPQVWEAIDGADKIMFW
jgi:predicted peroxiredoxin